ncbi:MAG: 8-oxo-dGTP diphosphatase [Halanaerobiales bacterium]|nr:8-oxo-dGTP diphosphatase [Halanaerobiales bacterium]
MRDFFYLSTICYLTIEEKVLMLNFKDKWNNRSCAPGGKMNKGETPTECIIREFYEETGLLLKSPYLRGIVQWINEGNKSQGLIFIYQCDNYTGNLLEQTDEGFLSWIPIANIPSLNLFSINKHFIDMILHSSNFFEGTFYIDQNTDVISFELKEH